MTISITNGLEYELAYYDSEVHRFNHYTTRTPPYITRLIAFHIALIPFEKGMNPIILPPAMGK